MSDFLDLSDVPAVSSAQLGGVMNILVSQGRAGVLFRGPDATDRAEVEAAFWQTHDGATADGVATLLRFWALVDLFQNRRMATVFRNRGYAILAVAAQAASNMRFNANWGFNPQRFMWALDASMAQRSDAVPAAARKSSYTPLSARGFQAAA